MYHTEGYLDKQTYLNEGHIYCKTILYQGKICYIWCVTEHMEKSRKEWKRLKKKIRRWTTWELTGSLAKGTVDVQKELNRFRAFLNSFVKDEKSEKEEAGGSREKRILLHLYHKNMFWGFGEGSWWFVSNSLGLYVSEDVSNLTEVRRMMQQEAVDITERKTKEGMNTTAEQLGNQLKKVMLRAMSEGRLEKGYFFLWEDRDAF